MSILVDLVKEDFGISGRGRWFRSDIHSSLIVDSEKDLYYFNSRDLKGNAVHYLMNIRGFKKDIASKFVSRYITSGMPESANFSIQTRFEKLVDLFHNSGKNNRQYWYDRLLTDSTIDRYRLGYFDDWSLIPIYDGGLFYNFQCRKDKPEKKIKFWYADNDFKLLLYNKDVLNFVTTAYITEGMVDCILMNQLGFPTVCAINGSMSWDSGWIKYFTHIKEVYYISDNDRAGIVSAKSIARSLGDQRVKVLRFRDEKDKYGSLDFFREGGSVDDFKNLLAEKSIYSFEKELI